MPRKAKDDKVIEEKKTTKKATKKTTVSKTKTADSTKKKVATKNTKSVTTAKKKTTTTKTAKEKTLAKKADSKIKVSKTTTKKQTKASPSVKKVAAKTTTKAKKTVTKKATVTKKTTAKKAKALANKKPEIIEYYDLPYKYNKTVVKLLAQTPTTLFVYWEISNKDKEDFINTYGEFFFNNTKPVLVIHNRSLNYSFEIDINDFANSWYIHVNDANCDYSIELGRRGINKYIDIPNNYLYISNSNEIESPNDHILFEKLPDKVLFKNVKTNYTMEKAIFYYLAKIKSTYNVKDFYKTMYMDEDFDFDKLTLKNPSSSSPTY